MKEVKEDFKVQTRNNWKLKGNIVTKNDDYIPQARYISSDNILDCEAKLEQKKSENSDDEYVM